MTRTMYDSTNPAAIPTSAVMVAGYLAPSPYAWSTSDWNRFPNAVQVRIAVRASTNDGHVLDVENGDASPTQAPGWVTMRRATGADPSVYCNTSTWPSVQAAFTAAGVAQPHYWVAAYPGTGPNIPAGAVAHQYVDEGNYDLSVVADFWPGVDQGDPMTDPNLGGFLYSGGPSTKAATPGHMPAGVDETSVFGRVVDVQAAVTALTAQVTTLTSQVAANHTAELAAVTAQQAAVLAAIHAIPANPTAQQLAAALAPALVALLPPIATPAQVAAAVEAELSAILGKAGTTEKPTT
jgi:hypothetical protein